MEYFKMAGQFERCRRDFGDFWNHSASLIAESRYEVRKNLVANKVVARLRFSATNNTVSFATRLFIFWKNNDSTE